MFFLVRKARLKSYYGGLTMTQNDDEKTYSVFVPLEDPSLAKEEIIVPYNPGLICIDWLAVELNDIAA